MRGCFCQKGYRGDGVKACDSKCQRCGRGCGRAGVVGRETGAGGRCMI